jgi:hypothetical protein
MTTADRIEKAIATRRGFLKSMGAAGIMAMLPRLASSKPPDSAKGAQFVFTRIKYDKGDWNTDTLTEGLMNGSEINLLGKMNQALQFDAFAGEHSIRADSDEIFEHPFLYITGHGECELSDLARSNIKKIIEHGGFMLADNCSGAKGVGFDRAFRSQLQLIFPGGALQVLPMSHPVFHSYAPIDKVLGGDKRLDPFIEGMDLDGRTAVIYTRNDLGCAWEGHVCHPGGESQRKHAFDMGINIIFYAVSGV